MKLTERNCLKCGKLMNRAHGAKYCLDCSVELARAKQAAWYRAYREKKRLAKKADA